MLTSIALIFLIGMFLGWIFKKIQLPSLIGMIVTGIILGPCFLNLIDKSILDISADLRQIALVVILTRAGLSLDIKELKKSGRCALLMCFVPASFEIIGTIIFAPLLFNISYFEAALIGSVIAAVSPAVVVPRMLKVMNEGFGTNKQVPQIIMAGASADDVYVIVLLTSFSAILAGKNASISDFVQIPTSILIGIALGIVTGLILNLFFRKIHMRDSAKLIILMSLSFLIIALQDLSADYIRVSGLIAIMVVGMTVFAKYPVLAKRLSEKYNKLWVVAEIVLFVLVGSTVKINSITKYGVSAVILLVVALIFRMLGVLISLLKSKLNSKERIFCMLAYTPKATVQAAIGAIPLAMGLDCGGLVLSIAVLSIIITAPFGAFIIDLTYKKLLSKSEKQSI